MSKMDDILKKNYLQIKNELIPPKKECPKEDLLWNYAQGKLPKKEKERINGHLLACFDCLESLKVIKMIEKAKKSTQKVPPHLHKKAKEILQKELQMPGMQAKDKKVLGKVSLLWDQLINKITQLTPDFDNLIGADRLQFQPVRKIKEDLKKDPSGFPYRKTLRINEEIINLDIDRSGKEGYLTLKVVFHYSSEEMSDKVSSGRVILYKSNKMYSSVYFDRKGEAVFNRLKEGEYSLELLMEEKSLGIFELSINKVSQ